MIMGLLPFQLAAVKADELAAAEKHKGSFEIKQHYACDLEKGERFLFDSYSSPYFLFLLVPENL